MYVCTMCVWRESEAKNAKQSKAKGGGRNNWHDSIEYAYRCVEEWYHTIQVGKSKTSNEQ
jgi:hypothetical protein